MNSEGYMARRTAGFFRAASNSLYVLGAILMLIGGVVGWVPPSYVHGFIPPSAPDIGGSIGSNIGVPAYLGAILTALSVIIAILTGIVAFALQFAADSFSIALAREMLVSLTPFLMCWTLTIVVSLVYFLEAPTRIGQLWQVFVWFIANVVLMMAYLLQLPKGLTGSYVAYWATGKLMGKPIERWMSSNGYQSLLAGMATAMERSDTGSVEAMSIVLGPFLAAVRDKHAEDANTYHRLCYRALKNLLSASAQHAGTAPNAAIYNLGCVVSGTILQAIAIGQPIKPKPEGNSDLYDGIFRNIYQDPARLNAVWSGVRHSLCRSGLYGAPLLLQYWYNHHSWELGDARRVHNVAGAVFQLHLDCRRELIQPVTMKESLLKRSDPGTDLAARMLIDLYRSIAIYLGSEDDVEQTAGSKSLPLELLESIHALVQSTWLSTEPKAIQRIVQSAFEEYRARLQMRP